MDGMMDAETDDLAPLMRAIDNEIVAWRTAGGAVEIAYAAVRRKAEQYGAWQRAITFATFADDYPSSNREAREARDAYFAD